MGFSRQEYWSGLPCLSPGDLLNSGIEPGSPTLQADSLPSERPGKPNLPPEVTCFCQAPQALQKSVANPGGMKKSQVPFSHLKRKAGSEKPGPPRPNPAEMAVSSDEAATGGCMGNLRNQSTPRNPAYCWYLTHTHTHKHTHSHVLTHSDTHTHTQSHTVIHTHRIPYSYTVTHTHTVTQVTHTESHTHTQSHTHTVTYSHTHTHTHTHTLPITPAQSQKKGHLTPPFTSFLSLLFFPFTYARGIDHGFSVSSTNWPPSAHQVLCPTCPRQKEEPLHLENLYPLLY